MKFTAFLAVACGGALGSLARYAAVLLAQPISGRLPWGTIVINILGSFVIGFYSDLSGPGGRLPSSDSMRLFVMVGLCGGFTTFSAFSLQTLELVRMGAPGRAALNVGLSIALCLTAVWAGDRAAGFISARPPVTASLGGSSGV